MSKYSRVSSDHDSNGWYSTIILTNNNPEGFLSLVAILFSLRTGVLRVESTSLIVNTHTHTHTQGDNNISAVQIQKVNRLN